MNCKRRSEADIGIDRWALGKGRAGRRGASKGRDQKERQG